MRKHLNKPRRSQKRFHPLTPATVIVAIAILAVGAATVASKQSGQTRQLTSDEAERLAAGLGPLVNQSSEGLVEIQHADGSVSLSLEGHFQNVTVARVNESGGVSQSCVDNPQSAGAFFGIDPKLIENRPVALERNEDR